MNDDAPKMTDAETEALERFRLLALPSRRKVLSILSKNKRLIENLRGDLAKHGDPEQWKRNGDLLLANSADAKRKGDRILVTDYYSESTPTIEIEGDANRSVSEIAEEYFRKYTKARNGLKVISERISNAEGEIERADQRLRQIDTAIEAGDEEFLASLIAPVTKARPAGRKKKAETAFKGARRFMSTGGFEILVGKKATDNDFLTFRIARSLDLWMHAADYPGSHVVIRNPNRKEIPNQTLVEAAQLAAFYSSGRKQTKAAVNYTLKKFVNKPKRSLPGLVSMASFKTILVEPKVGDVTLKEPQG